MHVSEDGEKVELGDEESSKTCFSFEDEGILVVVGVPTEQAEGAEESAPLF